MAGGLAKAHPALHHTSTQACCRKEINQETGWIQGEPTCILFENSCRNGWVVGRAQVDITNTVLWFSDWDAENQPAVFHCPKQDCACQVHAGSTPLERVSREAVEACWFVSLPLHCSYNITLTNKYFFLCLIFKNLPAFNLSLFFLFHHLKWLWPRPILVPQSICSWVYFVVVHHKHNLIFLFSLF